MSEKKLYDKALLPMMTDSDLRELARLGDISDHDAAMARYRRATTTLTDIDSLRYREIKARRDAAQKEEQE